MNRYVAGTHPQVDSKSDSQRSSRPVLSGGPLTRLFAPDSIAVVGASNDPSKAGHQMLQALGRFRGRVVAVHPSDAQVCGVDAFPSLTAVPHPIDLAILTVPAQVVPAVIHDCIEAGTGAAVICAGGFAEAGDLGESLQRRISDAAAEAGLRLLGPNTSGFVQPSRHLYATFVPTVTKFQPGGLAVVAQSGGVNLAWSFLAHASGLGLRLGVGLGNAVDVDQAEVLEHLASDASTTVVALHVEGVRDGERLFAAIEGLTDRVPVVALAVGQSDVSDFAQSHTGALIGDRRMTQAVLQQAGAVVVQDTTEMLDAVRALASGRIPPTEHPGIGVVTGQAGPGLLIVDALRSAAVAVPELAAATRDQIEGLLPALTYQRNPVDTGRPTGTFSRVLAAVLGDPLVHALVVFALHEREAVDLAASIGHAAHTGAPILCATAGLPDEVDATRSQLADIGIPLYDNPEGAARGARALVLDAQARWRRGQPEAKRTTATEVPVAGPAPTTEVQAKAWIAAAGLTVPEHRVCKTRAEAHLAMSDLGSPVVVKILDPAVMHKSEAGGVHVGVSSTAQLNAALDAIDQIGADRGGPYLVEVQAPDGPELIIGATKCTPFGPLIMLGLGGTGVEALRLVSFRRLPLRGADARDLSDSMPGRQTLEGFRGWPSVDDDELVELLLTVASLVLDHPEVAELDLNPVRVTNSGLVVLDALMVIDT